MKRTALTYLNHWKEKSGRVPLLIRGARQVGKTWLVRELSRSFNSFMEINFESDLEFHQLFQESFGKPDELIKTISLISGKSIVPGETLLFLDEIQELKEAILSLRYFKEKLPNLHVIAAGSLLEFAIRELKFPVGRLDFLHIFPLNFEEYLYAFGREDILDAVSKANASNPIAPSLHEFILEQITTYILLGGMPEAIKEYRNTKDLRVAQDIQQRLVATFREDFYKYSKRTKVYLLRKTFESIPRLLGQKFKYCNVDRDHRSRELSSALELLVEAGLAYKVFHSSSRGVPLAAQRKESKFKVFLVDVGLAQRLLGLSLSKLFLERKMLLSNRGGIAEQFVAQEILSRTAYNDSPRLHYWHRELRSSKAEVDFVIELDGSIVPIEVKSGKGSRVKSLRIFKEDRDDYVNEAVKISSDNFSERDFIKNIPFYAIGNLLSRLSTS